MFWLVVILLFFPYFAFASPRFVRLLRRFNEDRLHGVLLAATFMIPFILAAWPATKENPQEFALGCIQVGIYILLPTLLVLFRPLGRMPLDWMHIFAILTLWFPIEFDWLPDVSVQLASGLSLPVPKLIGLDLAFLLFLVIRPLEGVGYSYRLSRREIAISLVAFLAFALVGLPLGFALRFIQVGLAQLDVFEWIIGFLAIYFLIGIPEELLFRGIFQNMIEKRFGRSWLTLLVSAVIFGAAHLDNATAGFPVPNFAYMLMASLAGLAYGWAWQHSGKITSAALTHTLVDWLWGIILRG